MKNLIRQHLLIVLLICFATIIRLYKIETLTSFQGDQGRDLLAVLQIVANHNLTLLGSPSTFGPYQGPLYYYLLVPGMFLSNLRTIGPLIATVLWNVSGMILLSFLCQRFFSRNVGLIAGFIYALSPLLVETGRTLLNAYFGMPIYIAALYFLFQTLLQSKKPRSVFVLALGFTAGCLVQLHYNFLPFFAFCLFVPIFFKQLLKRKYYLFVTTGFVVASLPQILFELTHAFLNTHLLIDSLQTGKAMGQFSTDYIFFFFSTIGYLFGFENSWYGATIFFLIFLTLVTFAKRFSNSQKIFVKVLAMYFFFFLLLASLSRVRLLYPAYHYYFSIIPILLIAVSIVLSKVSRFLIILSILTFASLSYKNLDFGRSHGFTMAPNWSLLLQEKIADTIAKDAKHETEWNVASLVDGDTNGLPFRYLLSARKSDNYLGVDSYPRSKTVYLITTDNAEKVYDAGAWEIQSLKPFKITKVWVEYRGINLYRLEKI